MKNVEIKRLENSEVELTGELAAEEFAKYRAPAIAHLNEHASIPGFRAGHVPENVLISNLGEEKILVEMAEMALQELYPKIVEEEKIDAIGRPEITITKLAKDNPLGFKIKTAVAPEIKLPDYKKVAKEENSKPVEAVTVEDKEVDQVIEEIRHNRAHQENGGAHKEGEALPELNDDFAKSVGSFQTLEELKNKIKENLTKEKEYKARDKKRLSIMEAVIAGSDIALPEVLIEGELDRMVAELKNDIERVGLKFEDYLKHLKKTAEELRAAWRADAEKRLKTSLILDKIAAEEKLTPSEEDLKKEIEHLKSHYKDVPEERIRHYLVGLLTNEEVWKWLENQK